MSERTRTEGEPHQQRCRNIEPQVIHVYALAFGENKHEEDQRRDEQVSGNGAGNVIGEDIGNKQRYARMRFAEKGNEKQPWNQHTDDTER